LRSRDTLVRVHLVEKQQPGPPAAGIAPKHGLPLRIAEVLIQHLEREEQHVWWGLPNLVARDPKHAVWHVGLLFRTST
jgi:hypothetical protein